MAEIDVVAERPAEGADGVDAVEVAGGLGLGDGVGAGTQVGEVVGAVCGRWWWRR